MKRSILLLVGFSFLFLMVTAQDKIYFLNQSDRQIHIRKRTVLETGSFPYVIDTLNSGFQSIPIYLDQSAMLYAFSVPPKGKYGTSDAFYYLFKPGDSLVVTLDEEQKPVFTHISNPVRTKELGFFKAHVSYTGIKLPYTFPFLGNSKVAEILWGSNLKSRDKLLDSMYRPYLENIHEFSMSRGYSPGIANLFRMFYLSQLYSDKLFEDRQVNETVQKSLNQYYKDSLDVWLGKLNCDNCENIPSFNRLLWKIYKMQLSGIDDLAYLNALENIHHKRIKNFLMARLMMDRIEQTNSNSLLFQTYRSLSDTGLYQNMVLSEYKKRGDMMLDKEEMATLMKEDGTVIGFSDLLKQLKGNVVYIDFWASWCAPCIGEFPWSHALQKKSEGKKIVFLYLSVDDNISNWKESRKKHKVDGPHSYLLLSQNKSELAKKIDLGPIPRYLIVDSNGKIVRLHAPRPSDSEIYPTLLGVLNEN